MIESFKINCYPLNRSIRITINLPKNYNNTNRYYPVIYFLDGQNVFNDKDSLSGISLNLANTIDKLEEINKSAIYVCIASAIDKEKREKEYKEDTLYEFILNEIHPLIKMRYRINNYIYSFGCSKACYTALKLAYSNEFKGAVLLSPIGNFKKISRPTQTKLIYISAGKKELDGLTIKNIADIKQEYDLVHIVLNDNQNHDESAWKELTYEALNFLIL